MARINLLPWREKLRKEQQKEFYVILGIGAAVGAVIMLLVHMQINAMIDHQHARNQYLQREITELDRRIAEIKKLEETRNALIERMRVIEELQTSRPVVVHLFDELVKTLPDGLFITSLTQQGSSLKISGRAESHARVSTYMQNLDASDWLASSTLNVIEAKIDGGHRVSDFSLGVRQKTPKARAGGAQQ